MISLNMTKAGKESHLRSILKGVTWRVVATSLTILIAYFVTGTVDQALQIGAVGFVLKILGYYVHERLWQLAPRGSVRETFNVKDKS